MSFKVLSLPSQPGRHGEEPGSTLALILRLEPESRPGLRGFICSSPSSPSGFSSPGQAEATGLWVIEYGKALKPGSHLFSDSQSFQTGFLYCLAAKVGP